MGGSHGERCFQLRLAGGNWGRSKSAICDQRIPMHWQWQRVFGAGGRADRYPDVEVSISSLRVTRVNLFLAHPASSRPANWHSYELRSLDRAKARRAHVKRDFRYAVLTGRGTTCVKKVRAFDRTGELVEARSLPCEY